MFFTQRHRKVLVVQKWQVFFVTIEYRARVAILFAYLDVLGRTDSHTADSRPIQRSDQAPTRPTQRKHDPMSTNTKRTSEK